MDIEYSRRHLSVDENNNKKTGENPLNIEYCRRHLSVDEKNRRKRENHYNALNIKYSRQHLSVDENNGAKKPPCAALSVHVQHPQDLKVSMESKRKSVKSLGGGV